MIRFILCVIVVVGFLILSIPILFVEWDHRQIQSYGKGNQLSSDRSGSISFYPVDIRCEADCYRRGKCTN